MKTIMGLILSLAWLSGPAAARTVAIDEWVSQAGARVLFLAATDIPMIDLSIDVDAGSRWDPASQSGLSSMTQALLFRGVRQAAGQPGLTEQDISEAFAGLAVQFGGSASLDRASLSFRLLSDADVREPTGELVARILAHPAFDSDILEREQKRMIASIQESMTQPQSIARRALWAAAYGDHPYGAQATQASVSSIKSADLFGFHQRFWQPQRMRITIVGDLTRTQAEAWVNQLLKHLPATSLMPSRVTAEYPRPVVPQPARRQAIDHPASQSHVWLGMPAMRRDDPDFFAMTLGNYILGGGGFVSRLTEEIREKRGLSYSVFSAFQPLAQQGPFMIGLQTQKAQAPEALRVVEQTLERFLREGPTEQELKAAKQNLIGGFALRIDTNRKLLDNLAQINYYDLPLDYLQTWTDKIAAVRASDIQRAMQRLISQKALSVVVVAGPEGWQP